MGKDISNPFASLDVKAFPSRSGGRPAAPKCRAAMTIVKNKAAARTREDEDAELFLAAMAGTVTRPADSTGPGETEIRNASSAKGRAPHPDSGKVGAGIPAREPSGDNPFAAALKGVRPLGKSAAAPVERPVPSGDAVPSHECVTLAGMARTAAAIGRDAGPDPVLPGTGDEKAAERDFLAAVKGTKRLSISGREVPAEPEIPPVPVTDPRHPLQDFMEGKVEFSVAGTDEYMEGHVVGLDLMIVSQLQSGSLSPEAHIDLHGLNCEQAFGSLVGFFKNSWYKGARVVLIVTGRGLNSANGMPVLRGRMREWLTHDPFKRVVLAFCSAKQEDGGAGALYVLLRKHRKNSGRIRWDAMPSDPDLYL